MSVTLDYRVECVNGGASERFVWRPDGGTYRLAYYELRPVRRPGR